MRPSPRSALLLASLLPLAACSSNESGRLAARGSGDLGNLLAERTSPLSALDAVCGAAPGARLAKLGASDRRGPAWSFGWRPGASPGLRRAPYLQRVGATEVTIVWTSDLAGDARVRLRAPGGDAAATWEAVVDPSARLPRGERQFVARVPGLSPGTTYCYEVEQGDARLAGPVPLRTAPPSDVDTVRFVAFGDSGEGGTDQAAVLRQLETVPFDLMVHTGDIAYDDGTLDDFERKFFGVYAPYLRSLPLFPASGNHEYETDDAAPFRQVFVLPENGGPEGRERWYSFDWGHVHFVALDTEKMGPVQAQWLDADLTANRLPWTIVYGHRPPHSSGDHGDDLEFQRHFGAVLERHRVPLVLSGHDHHYERFRPRGGITYVVTGGGGRGTRSVRPGPATAYGEAVLNFVQATVGRDRLVLHAIDATGREFDSAVIDRPPAPPPAAP